MKATRIKTKVMHPSVKNYLYTLREKYIVNDFKQGKCVYWWLNV